MKKYYFTAVYIILLSAVIYPQQSVDIIWEADAKASQVAFAPDGLTMYTGGLEISNPYSYGNLKKWDVPTRTLEFAITSAGSKLLGLTNNIAINPAGTFIASGHGDIYCVPPSGACYNVLTDFFIHNTNGGGAVFYPEGLDGIVTGVSFSRDGAYTAMGMRRTLSPQINVYRTSDFQLTSSFNVNNTGSFALAFSPSENILAAGMYEGHINFWNVKSGQLIRTIQHGFYLNGGYPVSVTFSPDGSLFASGGNGYYTKVKIWNSATGTVVHTLDGVYDGSTDIAFSPNGEYLAAGFREYVPSSGWRGIIRIWRVSDGALVKEYLDPTATGNGAGVTSIDFSAIGDNWFAYTYNGMIKFAITDLSFIAPVPVEFETFSADEAGNKVLLQWITSSETNNKGFDIERKNSKEIRWTKIGFIEGNGTSSERHSYTFTDTNVEDGKIYYRLKQMDFDGTFQYSGTIEIDISVPNDFSIQNYPNPFNPTTRIRYSIPESGTVQIKIFDFLGNQITTLVNENKSAGSYEEEFNAGGLASGVYIARLNVNHYSGIIKLIVSK